MTMINSTRRFALASGSAALLAALALAGCGRSDESTAQRRTDPTVAQRQHSDELHADASRSMDSARQAGRDMRDAGRSAADQTTNAVGDAAITTSINAELAKDPKLSSLAIDVDTSGGQVVLHGTAPDAAAKARATELAQGVRGVHSVDNELTVAPSRP